ncbi:MAG: phage tail fiber protein [Acetobacteraceae bacterium]
MAKTGYLAKDLLNWAAGMATMPALAGRWIALFTTAPGDNDSGAVEVSGGAYARAQLAGTAATSAATSSGATLTFSSVPSWVAAGMTVLDLATPAAIGAGVTVSSKTSTTVTLSASVSGTVGSGDTIAFSVFPAATGAGPANITSSAALSFPQATASWGTVVAWGVYDAATSGNLLYWDWLGNDPWFPFDCTDASPGVLTAYGITAGSSPALANGAAVAITARFGGALPSGLSSETVYTVAGLSADAFNVGAGTSSTGSGMVRQVTQQPIAQNVTFSIPSGSLLIYES